MTEGKICWYHTPSRVDDDVYVFMCMCMCVRERDFLGTQLDVQNLLLGNNLNFAVTGGCGYAQESVTLGLDVLGEHTGGLVDRARSDPSRTRHAHTHFAIVGGLDIVFNAHVQEVVPVGDLDLGHLAVEVLDGNLQGSSIQIIPNALHRDGCLLSPRYVYMGRTIHIGQGERITKAEPRFSPPLGASKISIPTRCCFLTTHHTL